MTRGETADIIVVGAGIAGASLAARVAPEARVIVLEMEDQPGFHATGRSAANYEPTYGPPVIRALTKASGDFFREPPQGFTASPLLSPRGVLLVGEAGDGALAEEAISFGYRRCTEAEAISRLPVLRPGVATHLLLDDSTMDVDVELLHRGFLAQLRRVGGKLVCKAGLHRAERREGSWRAETAAGVFTAPVLANAAGAWADVVAERCGLAPLGLVPKRRSACIVAGPAGHDVRGWAQIADLRETFYSKPTGGKLMISPCDAEPGEPHDAFADDLLLAEAIDRYQTFLDHEVTRIERSWGGLRTFAPDGNPVVGFDPRQEGFFWCAGQGGYGIQTSPALSLFAAALLHRKALPVALEALSTSPNALSPSRLLQAA